MLAWIQRTQLRVANAVASTPEPAVCPTNSSLLKDDKTSSQTTPAVDFAGVAVADTDDPGVEDDDQFVTVWDSNHESEAEQSVHDDMVDSDGEDEGSGDSCCDVDFFDDVLEELGLQDVVQIVDDPLLEPASKDHSSSAPAHEPTDKYAPLRNEAV